MRDGRDGGKQGQFNNDRHIAFDSRESNKVFLQNQQGLVALRGMPQDVEGQSQYTQGRLHMCSRTKTHTISEKVNWQFLKIVFQRPGFVRCILK